MICHESSSFQNEFSGLIGSHSVMTTEYQSHGGTVNIMTTPKVEYGYADGTAHTIRPTSLTYPNGRELTYDYGTSGGINDRASRIASIVDDDDTHLVGYQYLGRQSFVEQESLS
jgi:hypothetical protein